MEGRCYHAYKMMEGHLISIILILYIILPLTDVRLLHLLLRRLNYTRCIALILNLRQNVLVTRYPDLVRNILLIKILIEKPYTLWAIPILLYCDHKTIVLPQYISKSFNLYRIEGKAYVVWNIFFWDVKISNVIAPDWTGEIL